jgi:hypothetical protein
VFATTAGHSLLGSLRFCVSESLPVTHPLCCQPSAGLAKSTMPRANAARFQSLMKAPKANSFVLDSGDKPSSSAINPPVEGRIPDAI